MPAHGSWTHASCGWASRTATSPSGSAWCPHTSAPASSGGTTVPPPSSTAPSSQRRVPFGSTAIAVRGGSGTAGILGSGQEHQSQQESRQPQVQR